MTSLGTTIAGLSKFRREWSRASAGAPAQARRPAAPSRLRDVAGFGSNPGNLRMFEYVPKTPAPAPALVVVLHGCTQTAAGYDHGTGWSTLADQQGFVLLFPEQQRANNPNTCFTWFEPGDTRRDAGEALSIRQMIDRAVAAHGIDRSRIFVTGLSAGAAMAGVMLATYPEVFAGGALVAGLPYGAASGVAEAFESMFQGRSRPAREWGDLVRSASPHRGAWPRVSVWHGDADTTVKPTNATEIVKQWSDVHGIAGRPALESKGPGFTRQVWKDDAGREVVESFTIGGMGHGTPLAAGTGEGRYGVAGPYLLDVGVSSTYHIARFWGLMGQPEHASAAEEARPPHGAITVDAKPETVRKAAGDGPRKDAPKPGTLPIDIQAVITKALRSAGLMK